MSNKGVNIPSDERIQEIFRKFGGEVEDKDSESPAIGTKSSVITVDINKLKPHPRNTQIYGEENVEDLVVQIEAYGGIANPLLITDDFTIISGHRRWQAACQLGMTEVPCQIVSYNSEEEELAALVMLNYHRTKTNVQKAREGMALEQSLKAEGMERKLRALRQNHSDRDPGSPTDASADGDSSSLNEGTEVKKGRTRDLVAEAVKISSGKTFDRMKKVITAADTLKAEGKAEDSEFLLQMMDRSVKPASNLLDAGYLSLPDEERQRIRSGEVPVNEFVSKQTSKPKPRMSFKKIVKGLSSAEQMLSDLLPAVDTLGEPEVAKLVKNVESIESVLAEISAKLKTSVS